MDLNKFTGLCLESLKIENVSLDLMGAGNLQMRESLMDLLLVDSEISGDFNIFKNLKRM